MTPRPLAGLIGVMLLSACAAADAPPAAQQQTAATAPAPDHTLSADRTHARFSAAIEPVLRVQPGAVIEAFTKEASDGQLGPTATVADLATLSFDPIHPLTGPVFVEGAQPGDVLAVTLHEIEIIDFGWAAIVPGFGFLADEFPEPYVRTFTIAAGQNEVAFNDRIRIPLRPFAGVMGVAPATDSMLSTIPPRANGGNMDNRHLTAGTTVYFPVFVPGALFSIGDTHAVQGDGEISGTAIESPMRIVYELNLVRGAGAPIAEPQYENDLTYGVTAFATTIDEAARKASRYMIDYLTSEHGLSRPDAYLLASFAADLKIAEVVDVPHVLVAMHIDKNVLGTAGRLRFADRYAR